MSEAKHTPTPWKLDDIAPHDPKWEAFEIWNEKATREMIANGAGRANIRVFGKANAAFIVRAVNAHDGLVKALQMIRDADNDCKSDGLPRIPAAARATIDAVLAKANSHSPPLPAAESGNTSTEDTAS